MMSDFIDVDVSESLVRLSPLGLTDSAAMPCISYDCVTTVPVCLKIVTFVCIKIGQSTVTFVTFWCARDVSILNPKKC